MLESDSFALVEGFFFLPFPFKAVVHSRKEAFWQTLFMVAFWGHEGGVSPFTEIFSIICSFIEGLFRGLLFGKVFMFLVYISCLAFGQWK